MATATLTTKGQVTIPKEIRDSLNLHTGDRIEIVMIKDKEAVIRPITKTIEDLYCRFYKEGRKTVSIEEMDETIRRKVAEKNK